MSRKEVLVIVLIIAASIALLVPMVWRARLASQRLASQNNLKQLSLAVANYESAWRRLPPGCDAPANHGWTTFVQPYIEASSLYSQIDLNRSWDHPVNRYLYLYPDATYLNPQLAPVQTSMGYGLSHYEANAALFHRASEFKPEEFDKGATWCFTEVFDAFKPKHYPYNWRSIQDSQRSAAKHNANFFQIATLDCSVRAIDVKVDSLVIEQIEKSSPLPESVLDEVPVRNFELTTARTEAHASAVEPLVPFDEPIAHKGGPFPWRLFRNNNPNWTALTCWIGAPQYTPDYMRETLGLNPDIRTFILNDCLTNELCEIIVSLPNLKTLKVTDSELSESSLLSLATHRTLNEVIGLDSEDQSQFDRLQ